MLIIQDYLILSGLGAIFLVFARFLPSYFTAKGKNLATKEDISEITDKVENIKHEYLKETEQFKITLSKELELLKINEATIQSYKPDEFIDLVEYFNDFIANPKKVKQIETNSKAQNELNKKMVNLGVKLFFFASDETVQKYIEWKTYNKTKEFESDPFKVLYIFAELILMMRRDLGHQDTSLKATEYLSMILSDYHENAKIFRKYEIESK